MDLKKFLESPANRVGLSAWIGTVITGAIQVAMTRHMPPIADLLGFVVGLVAIIQPDNSVTVAQLERAIADVVALKAAPSAATITAVADDAETIAADILTPNKPTK